MTLLATTFSYAAEQNFIVYAGTYTGRGSEGIYAYRFDAANGQLASIGLAVAAENPSFLAVDPNGKFLYAVNEVGSYEGKPSGAVSAFAVDRASGKLKLLGRVVSEGTAPAHLSMDETGRYVLVANYGTGSVAVFPVEGNGQLGTSVSVQQHKGSSINKERQQGPHAHAIITTPDNRFAVAADLGTDELRVYRFDAAKGTLTPNDPPLAKVEAGSGPRHLAIAPSGKFVYLANELASAVTVFALEPESGKLQERQTASTVSNSFSGKNTAAAVVVDRKGKFLYVSNRGEDSIAVFAVDPKDGRLSFVERVSSGGKTPRYFAIDPSGKWLFAANQNSNDIQLFRIDAGSGKLTPAARVANIVSPVCVAFVATEK